MSVSDCTYLEGASSARQLATSCRAVSGSGFQMTLHADNGPADLERLILTAIALRQAHSSQRQIERLSVPVKRLDRTRKSEARRADSVYSVHGKPTDLLHVM